jgi:formiminotetrahydrofolate cyclodeaminase
MTRLTDRALGSLLEAFSSPDPTPGGGSASAIASAIGVSLLAMVAAMPKTRSNTDHERTILQETCQRLCVLRDALRELINKDSEAYDQVVAAYGMPKTSEQEKAERREAIQRGLTAATEVPLQVMRLSVDAMRTGSEVARRGNPSAASDVGVGFALLVAGLRGAGLNVNINLEGLVDRQYAEEVGGEVARLWAEADQLNVIGNASTPRE